MKTVNLSELKDDTLVIAEVENEERLITVEELKIMIESNKVKNDVYTAIKTDSRINIDDLLDTISNDMKSNDLISENDYLNATQEEMEQLQKIFDNITSKLMPYYVCDDFVDINK